MLAVAHLAALGRRRIAHDHRPGAVRGGAACANAATARRSPRPACRALPSLSGSWSEAWGREAVADTLLAAQTRRPTRSSAATTRSRAARSTRCANGASSVPDDVAIVGFDNWDVMTEATRPPLTSVDMNLKALGREAGSAPARDDRRASTLRGRAAAALHPRRPRARAARIRGCGHREADMSKDADIRPVPFADVRVDGAVLARAARDGADAHHPEPARQARGGRHPRIR